MTTERERELIEANNRYLERARAAERRLKQVEEERDRATRRCDMYHGQCDRQADELRKLRGEHMLANLTAHRDDVAVDRFAAAMKAKLAKKRAEGRGGWNDPIEGMDVRLSGMLRKHVDKGDPVDVANFAMMLHQRGEAIVPTFAPAVTLDDLRRRGRDDRLDEVLRLVIGIELPAATRGKVSPVEAWALGYGIPCACGERGLDPTEADDGDLCAECKAAEVSS
jgi:hypothetical protein